MRMGLRRGTGFWSEAGDGESEDSACLRARLYIEPRPLGSGAGGTVMRTILILIAAAFVAAAQPKPAITPADYGKWESLGATVLSPDGKWLGAPIRRSNGTSELRVHPVAGGAAKVAAFGSAPEFSSDSRWVAYAIGMSDA